MPRTNLTALVRNAATNLENALRHFDEAPGGLAQTFVELKLQGCIFSYDICAEVASLMRNNPTGFARSVALKGLVHKLYEYHSFVNESYIPRLMVLSEARGTPFDKATVKQLKAQWKEELRHLTKWKGVRNHATGHYDKSIAVQISHLKALDADEVLLIAEAFLRFNRELLKGLGAAGRGPRQ